ncbi:DUF6896 domain-containing protein [Streptomyces sp. NPDC048211]|uniref:DUF6896 domain-containing protein n=1 Tax=Streptomyces sp. NPDC048211 TaxID=3365516 RepID=UPI0037163609
MIGLSATLLEGALAQFSEARDVMRRTFSRESALEIVSAVRRDEIPRKGVCVNGCEYFVHGAGYTVVLPSGGQVHIDGDPEGDFFTSYDISFFLESSGGARYGNSGVRDACEDFIDQGILRRVGVGYSLVSPEGPPSMEQAPGV